MTPKQRSRARVVQAIYQWLVSGGDLAQIEKQFLNQKKCKAEFQLKKYDLALITAEKMISADQDFRTFANNRPFGYYWQGRIYEKNGKPKEAISAYEKSKPTLE